jgi:hypothetical protein
MEESDTAMPAQIQSNKSRARTWVLLGVLLLLCLGVIGFPLFIIRPFVHQAALPLRIALIMQRWAPWFTLLAFLGGTLLIIRSWAGRGERFRIVKNAALLAAVAGLGLTAWAARINVFERMFRPLADARLVPAARADLRPDDMVMAVNINGDERAYPVLQLAYHHVVNDVAGGVPIAATY